MSWLKNSEPFEKFCAVAFVFLATLSCLATAQSLTLTLGLEILPSWLTFIFAFILVFMLYALTSYLLVQIVNSLNDKYCAVKNIKLPQRRSIFIGSSLGVILLWLVCSMPTNTHSMLHMREAKAVATAELDKQNEVFHQQLKLTDIDFIEHFQEDSIALVEKVEVDRKRFHDEVKNPDRIGLGQYAESILNNIERDCGYDAGTYFVLIKMNDKSQSEVNRIIKHYDPKISGLRDIRLDRMRNERDNRIANMIPDKQKLNDLIGSIKKTKEGLKIGSVSINEARLVIDDGYSADSLYEQRILDKIEVLKVKEEGHKSGNVKQYNTYRIDRLYSVFNVWGDFFSGKLPKEFDMPYWILWALILDIAAFIFSTIAFRGKTKKTKF